MLRRARQDSLGGCWELPGGKVDSGRDGSEHPVRALAREVQEECGLTLCGTPRLIAATPRISPTGRPLRELTFLADVADGTERLSDEHDRACWHPLHEPAPGELTEAAADGLAALRAAA
jgi:8-oxo-dGTP diphosphatase